MYSSLLGGGAGIFEGGRGFFFPSLGLGGGQDIFLPTREGGQVFFRDMFSKNVSKNMVFSSL